jgi:hypothetical protein
MNRLSPQPLAFRSAGSLSPKARERVTAGAGQKMKRLIIPVALYLFLLFFTPPVRGQNPSSVRQEPTNGWTEKSVKGTFRKAYYSNDGICRIYLFKAENAILIITQKEIAENQILKEEILLEKNQEAGYSLGVKYYLVEESGEKSVVLKKKPNVFKTYLERTGQAEGLPPDIKAALESLRKF